MATEQLKELNDNKSDCSVEPKGSSKESFLKKAAEITQKMKRKISTTFDNYVSALDEEREAKYIHVVDGNLDYLETKDYTHRKLTKMMDAIRKKDVANYNKIEDLMYIIEKKYTVSEDSATAILCGLIRMYNDNPVLLVRLEKEMGLEDVEIERNMSLMEKEEESLNMCRYSPKEISPPKSRLNLLPNKRKQREEYLKQVKIDAQTKSDYSENLRQLDSLIEESDAELLKNLDNNDCIKKYGVETQIEMLRLFIKYPHKVEAIKKLAKNNRQITVSQIHKKWSSEKFVFFERIGSKQDHTEDDDEQPQVGGNHLNDGHQDDEGHRNKHIDHGHDIVSHHEHNEQHEHDHHEHKVPLSVMTYNEAARYARTHGLDFMDSDTVEMLREDFNLHQASEEHEGNNTVDIKSEIAQPFWINNESQLDKLAKLISPNVRNCGTADRLTKIQKLKEFFKRTNDVIRNFISNKISEKLSKSNVCLTAKLNLRKIEENEGVSIGKVIDQPTLRSRRVSSKEKFETRFCVKI